MADWERIDGIRSVSEMRAELEKLGPDLRASVIKEGLGRSRFQFTWSFFAKQFGVPEGEWPEQPRA